MMYERCLKWVAGIPVLVFAFSGSRGLNIMTWRALMKFRGDPKCVNLVGTFFDYEIFVKAMQCLFFQPFPASDHIQH